MEYRRFEVRLTGNTVSTTYEREIFFGQAEAASLVFRTVFGAPDSDDT